MPDASTPDFEITPQAPSVTSVSGGVNIDAPRDIAIGGDVVGRDKITLTEQINTGGGAVIQGNLTVEGSSVFAGRDIIGYTAEQVSTLLTQISSTFQPKPFDGRCPYLGLDAFSEIDPKQNCPASSPRSGSSAFRYTHAATAYTLRPAR